MELLLKRTVKITGRVEIARSCSRKLNIGNYESVDFFCSQKVECDADEAAEIAPLVHAFCKKQVLDAVQQYQHQANALFAPSKERKTA